MRLARAAQARLRSEAGYSLIEMLTVMLILGVVMASLTTLLMASTTAEADMNNRFQAQQEARLALDKLRREGHCSSGISTSSATSITLTMPSFCPTGNGSVTWCSVSISSQRYGLYRKKGATCDATGTKYADYLTSGNLFTYTAQSTSSLAKLHVDFPINRKPKRTVDSYDLVDDIVMRNSTRT